MPSKPQNLVIFISDEQSRKVLGCYGHPLVKTPNLDALARRGVRFTNSYCNNPICVPSRASFATGRYTHDIRNWDNTHPYFGSVPSWAHRLSQAGVRVESIGKLHYRNEEDDTGFEKQIVPMHVYGDGELTGLLRDADPKGRKNSKLAKNIGPGQSTYSRYDAEITEQACKWIASAGDNDGRGWVLFVSLVCPHYPLIAPPEFYHLYDGIEMPLPKLGAGQDFKRHPWIDVQFRTKNDDDFFTEETRAIAIQSYFGLCSYADHNIGQVIKALEAAGHSSNTAIIYSSDHGEHLGARRLWGKNNFYEESAGVPLIIAGPDVAQGRVCETPVSLVDLFPSVLEATGVEPAAEDASLPGRSLFQIAKGPVEPEREVFCEYHAVGSPSAGFMLRRGSLKYMHYVGYEPELFDLAVDPEEMNNLAADPAYRETVKDFDARLRQIVDPDQVDQCAKADQAVLIAAHGGREAIMARGSMQGTPAPGETPTFVQ